MAELFSLSFNIAAALKQMGVTMTWRIPQAVARGMNRTAASEKVAMSREIATDMAVKVTAVKEVIKVRNATAANLVVQLSASSKRIPLEQFHAKGQIPSRGRGRGVTYRIGTGARSLPHAFRATTRSGHTGVFERIGKSRLPIRELFGPSIAHVFGKLVPLGDARRQEVLVKNVSHEIEFALSKGA